MQEKNWGAFLCNCKSALNVDLKKIGGVASLVEVATDPYKEIQAFAKKVDEDELENVIVGCCAESSLFQKNLKNKNLHFLDLKGKCFYPHGNFDESHLKAVKLIKAEIEVSKIKAKNTIPVNPLQVGKNVLIYTEFAEGLKLAGMIEKIGGREVGDVTICISSEIEGLDENSPLLSQRSSLVGVEGRLGSFKIKLQPDKNKNGERQSPFSLKAEQVVIFTKEPPAGIKKRTGIHLLSSVDDKILKETVTKLSELVGNFHKPVHVKYDKTICAGGDKGIESCGRCISFCPYDAISRQTENSNLIKVDHFTCEGCGACASACPTSSLEFTEPSPKEIYARMATLLASPKSESGKIPKPVIVFHCEEMGDRVLEIAGKIPHKYSPSVLPVGVPCLRYVSESNMLAAFTLGAAGVGLLGCENCPNGERILLNEKFEFSQMILEKFEFGKERLQIFVADPGFEENSIRSLDEFASKLSKSVLVPSWNTPRQTGNREILREILGDFIAQTSKEPGRVKLSSNKDFAFVEVKEAGCTLCRSCANVCPTNAFKFDEEENSLNFKHINCVGCGLCEKVCPENVITLKHEIFLEKKSLDYLTVAEDEMVSCSKCNKPYINRRALEAVESKLFSIDSLKDTFSGDRRNILRMCPDCRTVEAVKEVEKGWQP